MNLMWKVCLVIVPCMAVPTDGEKNNGKTQNFSGFLEREREKKLA